MSTMRERDFRAWVLSTLTLTTLYALVFAGLCVFSATARIALLLGAFLSPFALPIIHPFSITA